MSFGSDLGKFNVELEKESSKVVRKIVFQAYKMIVTETPRITGRAKNNWYVKSGSKSSQTNDGTMGVEIDMTRVLAEVAKIDGTENDIYITNNLEYIVMLENGSSKQSPAGMVAVTVQELKSFIDSGRFKA